MTYRGKISKGVVVFEEPVPLADGTEVKVEVAPQSQRAFEAGTPEAIAQLPIWDMDDGELERLLAEVQEMRELDLRLQTDPPPLD